MDEQNTPPVISNPSDSGGLKKKFALVISVALVVLAAIVWAAFFRGESGSFSLRVNYPKIYTLVEDKVSSSAPIQINLPAGVAKEGIEEKVTFEPALAGDWVPTDVASVVAFKPAKKLEIGNHYTVALALEKGIITKDFQAAEDPLVEAILPKGDSEADESSAITIIFNRPIVPLTTLGELEKRDVPITMTPETEGKWKWISTRNLQFIPKTSLVASAHYTVKVGSGIVSMDGLAVKEVNHAFITRPLRLEGATSGIVRYNQPIEIRFNEPIDLEKTKKEITLIDSQSGQSLSFEASYGSRIEYDYEAEKSQKIEDKSVLSVIQKKDTFGRSGFWDFEKSYAFALSKAYPVGGDIVLSSPINLAITTTGVVQSVTAQSERTDYASTQLFDPKGTITIRFYEDIDFERSEISMKGLAKVEYGEKCKEREKGSYYYGPCEKVYDKSTLILSFDAQKFGTPGEDLRLVLDRVVNAEGITIDSKEIVIPVKVYPKLAIRSIAPAFGSTNGSVSELTLCTNTPLKPLSGKAFYDAVKTDKYIVLGRWNSAYPQGPDSYQKPRCNIGEFVNVIRYGLLPETDYSLSLSLVDVFGETAAQKVSFKTEKAPNLYLRFHALDKIYNVTTPGKTKLTYAVENFDRVDVHICKVEPLTMVRYLYKLPKNTMPVSSLSCIETKSDTIAISPKLWVNNYFNIDLSKYFADTRGHYIISFSNPRYTDNAGTGLYERTYVSVTNLAVAEKKVNWTKYDVEPQKTKGVVDAADPQGELYWVSRIGTLEPEAKASVAVVSEGDDVPVVAQSALTDGKGIAKLPLVKDVVGAVIKSGTDTAIISSWSDTLNRAYGGYSNNKVYVYTDRPIYRPGQEVFIKGIYRLNYDGEFSFDANEPVQLAVSDSRGEQIYTKNATVNKYGTWNASFTLPKDAALGGYYISAMGEYSYFTVQEYVGAAFEAKVDIQKDEYIAGESAILDITGGYYFGAPVDGGTVDYSITAQNFYFDRYEDEYFDFGGGWYECYSCTYGDTYVKSGQTRLDENGRVRVTQSLDFDELFSEDSRNSSKILVFHATIVDASGRSVSTEKSFIVHRGNFYLGVKADPYFTSAKEPFNIRLKTVDTKGKPVRESGIDIVVSKVEWKSFKRQEVDGNYYERTERVLVPVITRKAATDGRGDYKDSFTLESPGEYEISATADDGGNTIQAKTYLYVYGEGSVSVRPTNNATLDITAERTDLNVGDTAKILFQSPYPRAKALITIERGRIFDYEVVEVNKNMYEHEFALKGEHVPNVFASVILLSPDPEVKFGHVEIGVDRKEKELSISVATDKPSYLPGEKVTLKIITTDSKGKRVPAEVSVAVADLSILALKGNPKKNPLVFFYSGFPLAITTASNVKNILSEAQIPTGTKGGGGGDAADLAKKQRGEFKDTAFWNARVETDGNGEATVTFTLADNLTRWQIESLGVTTDTKLGVDYTEITAQKDVMLVPLRPRFVVPGDEFEIGAQVFNQTDKSQTLSISYQSDTLGIAQGGKTVEKTVRPKETATVFWSVKAPLSQTEGSHTIVLSAKNDEFDDTIEQVIPVNSNITYESVATAGSTEEKVAQEYVFIPSGVMKDRGGLTIKTSATLAVYLSEALKYLVEFPYGCSEQLGSKLSSIAILEKGLGVKNVREKFDMPQITFEGQKYSVEEVVTLGLQKIYDAQTQEGGFAYYQGLEADLYLTMNMLNVLADVRQAGYAVDGNVVRSAATYIESSLLSKGVKYYGLDAFISGAYALSRVGSSGSLGAIVRESADKTYIQEQASSMNLGYLALLSTQEGWPSSFSDGVFKSLQNRVDIDSRGAYVKSHSGNIAWQYYETPIKSTALYLKALSAGKRADPVTDKLLRWILSSRSKNGAWGSTQNTLSVIDAFTEYMMWKRETESDFALEITLDKEPLAAFDFNRNTVFSIFEKFVPVSTFTENTLHTISFEKQSRNNLKNPFYYDIGMKYYLPAEQIAPRDEGILIERNLYRLKDAKEEMPIIEAKVGEVVKGKIRIITGKPRNLFAVEDFIPAGFELVNFDLATEDTTLLDGEKRDWRTELYPDYSELRDDRLFLFKQELPAGEYEYEYFLRATTPGTFRHLPAVASEMYFPENFGRTGGTLFRVNK
jgi:uncharacterized protein YfaS (alpha-2-macroglobulin family)